MKIANRGHGRQPRVVPWGKAGPRSTKHSDATAAAGPEGTPRRQDPGGDLNRRGSARTKEIITVAFLAGLVYAAYSLAWPLAGGRDLGTYLLYYLDFWHATAVFPMIMTFRTPIAPFFFGPLLTYGGPIAAEVATALLYSAAITSVYITVSRWQRTAAILTVAALFVYPPYNALFHTAGSDSLFAALFLVWVAFFATHASRLSYPVMIAHGVSIAVLIMARPSSQILMIFVLWPLLFVHGPWRPRIAAAAVFLATSNLILLAWAAHNFIRYDDFTVARGGSAILPLYRSFLTDHTVAPHNGPASRHLSELVSTDVLQREPYRSSQTSVDDFFSSGRDEAYFDLIPLTDRREGWHTDYVLLRSVGLEAVHTHPHIYLRGVVRTLGAAFLLPYEHLQPKPVTTPTTPTPSVAPTPTTPPLPASPPTVSHMWWLLTTPNGTTTVDWSDVTHPKVVFAEASLQARYETLGIAHKQLGDQLPNRQGHSTTGTALNTFSRHFPPMIVWLLLALLAFIVTKMPPPLPLTFAAAVGLGIVIITFLGLPHLPHYRLPFDPLFIALGIIGVSQIVRTWRVR